MITLLEKVINHILGRKYWIVVLEQPENITYNCETKRFLSSFIFRKKEDAEWFYHDMKYGKSARSVEIVTFRSRNEYHTHDDKWKLRLN